MIQELSDIRVFLSNVLSKEYFLVSLRGLNTMPPKVESADTMTIDSMAQFFKVIINNIVKGQQQDNKKKKQKMAQS